MSDAAVFEVLLDCPHCRMEGAVLALQSAGEVEPIEQRCRLCLWPDAVDVTDGARAHERLTAFAHAEGEPDAATFCSHAIGLPVDEVLRRLARNDAIPTNFDAVAWLFGGSGRAGVQDANLGEGVSDGVSAPPPLPVPPPGPRTAARVLASVMVADGEIRPREQAYVGAWLAKQGLPAPVPSELRVWRPHEVARPAEPLRTELLAACVELAHVDEEPDDAEWRVIRSYARAWGFDDAEVARLATAADKRHATAFTHLWRRLTTLVRVR